MISTDFAPNEEWDDAWISLRLLFQPWRWIGKTEIDRVKKEIVKLLPEGKGMKNAFLYLTGRSALFNLLNSLNLPKNSEVLVQAFTCEAVILPIIEAGLKPVYIDIETDTFSMDPIGLKNKITDNTRALILQHSFGMVPLQREKLLSIVKKHNFVLIEDIAHGNSLKTLNKPLGDSIYLLSKSIPSRYRSFLFTAILPNLPNNLFGIEFPAGTTPSLPWKSSSLTARSTFMSSFPLPRLISSVPKFSPNIPPPSLKNLLIT